METRRFLVEPDEAGERIDAFLARRSEGELSRGRVQAMIAAGHVRIGEEAVAAPKRRVGAGESVSIAVPPPEDPTPEPEAIPLSIIHEDADLIVIDKPAGLVVHPAPGNWTGTLVNALLHHCGDELSGINGVRRPGIVHRLDKDTSGVMVVAKSEAAHKGLADQFAAHGRDGRMRRAYLAFVWGKPVPDHASIEAALGRSRADRTKRAVVRADHPDAREAVTHYTVRGAASGSEPIASLVECRLETGRTHQIRVHMAHIRHPILGDDVYGAGFRTKAARLGEPAATQLAALSRQALHAFELGFVHPASGEAMLFRSPLPADLRELAGALAIPLKS